MPALEEGCGVFVGDFGEEVDDEALGKLFAHSWDPLECSWEALGNILETFGGCLDAILNLGERIRRDLLKC